jgi:hypothetical protein
MREQIDVVPVRLPGEEAAEDLLRLDISVGSIKDALQAVVGLSEHEADAVIVRILERLAAM